jgi:thiol:disulfide interchange protein
MVDSVASPASRRKWLRRLLELLLFALVFLGVGLWQARDVPAGPAPAFEAPLAQGGMVELESWRAKHPDRPMAIHFWAEWCPICKLEEGSISSVAGDWPVLTVAVQSGGRDAVVKVLRERELHWPAAIDEQGSIMARYGLKGVPAFIVVDRQGTIRFVEVGYTSEIGMRLRLWWAGRQAY